MAEIYRSDIVRVDLDHALLRKHVGAILVTGDKLGNRFGAEIFRDGKPVDVTGCGVTAYFMRPGEDALVLNGTATGSVAYVDLAQACYSKASSFTLTIKISYGGSTTALRVIDGYILLTQTDELVAPGEVVPTLDDIFAQSAAMETATASAKEATELALAAKDNANGAAVYAVNIAAEKGDQAIQLAQEEADKQNVKIAALTEETAKNTEAIDSLNKGGLVMKEDFIGQQVNEWLDEHPEATTTVKDHSLTVDKLVIGTLGYVTPQMYGAVADGVTDDADALEAAILAGHKNIMIPENTTMQISGLTLSDIDGVTIDNRGKIVNAKGGPIIRQQGCSNVHLTGGEWVGDGSTDSQSLIVLDGCTNCHIDNMHISGAKNKAVEIKGNTTGCMVECLHIVSANGSSGAGVSLWGAEVKHNIISHIYCEDVRLGIAANGCSYNTFDDITCINTTSNGGGVLFDGMVSYSGDGAHDNVLSNLVVVNAGQYGGLYFGNGAHGNTCENIAVADSNHGVRMYSEQATPCYGNTVRGGTIKNCSEDGVALSQCNDNEVSGFAITNCPRGVDLYAASHNSVHDCIVRDCTINGIRVMTDYASIANCKVRGCASGIELAYGSGKNPADIMIEETWLIDNTTQYTPANGIQLGSTCRQLTTA